tara:strand:- start:121 stop:300 length:180 start_codon:yes stop_codon:yes gene_type:complete
MEKTITVTLSDKELKELEEKYKCNGEVLDLALDYALEQFKEYINHNLYDDVHNADLDVG